MGDCDLIQCKNCDYKEIFSLGIAFSYNSIENVLDSTIKMKKDREIIRNVLQENIVRDIYFSHILMVCNKCKKIYERFYVKIEHNKGIYVKEYRCPKCKRLLSKLETDKYNDFIVDDLLCPVCGGKSLKIEHCGNWD